MYYYWSCAWPPREKTNGIGKSKSISFLYKQTIEIGVRRRYNPQRRKKTMWSIGTKVARWSELREEILQKQKEMETIKEEILGEMQKQSVHEYTFRDKWLIRRRKGQRTSLCRKDVPAEIWDRYSTVTMFETLSMTAVTNPTPKPTKKQRPSDSPNHLSSPLHS